VKIDQCYQCGFLSPNFFNKNIETLHFSLFTCVLKNVINFSLYMRVNKCYSILIADGRRSLILSDLGVCHEMCVKGEMK
jgi:hypothetical protein